MVPRGSSWVLIKDPIRVLQGVLESSKGLEKGRKEGRKEGRKKERKKERKKNKDR